MNYSEQLKLDGNLLRRSAPQKKPKKPLRRVGKKREKENREYLKRRKAYLKEHPWCEAYQIIPARYKWQVAVRGGWGWARRFIATEIHHTKKPKCKYLNDESTWLAVSMWSHNWIEDHKKEARRLGLLHY